MKYLNQARLLTKYYKSQLLIVFILSDAYTKHLTVLGKHLNILSLKRKISNTSTENNNTCRPHLIRQFVITYGT